MIRINSLNIIRLIVASSLYYLNELYAYYNDMRNVYMKYESYRGWIRAQCLLVKIVIPTHIACLAHKFLAKSGLTWIFMCGFCEKLSIFFVLVMKMD